MQIGQANNDGTLGERDAIHVPCVLVDVSDLSNYDPGCPVRFTDNTLTKAVAANREDSHGVVDPFLELIPYPQRKWNPQTKTYEVKGKPKAYVFINPGLVTKLGHTFEPNITDFSEKECDNDAYYDDGCRGCY